MGDRTHNIELPRDIDIEIRAMAHRTGRSVNDIVVDFLGEAVIACRKRGVVSYWDLQTSLEAIKLEDE